MPTRHCVPVRPPHGDPRSRELTNGKTQARAATAWSAALASFRIGARVSSLPSPQRTVSILLEQDCYPASMENQDRHRSWKTARGGARASGRGQPPRQECQQRGRGRTHTWDQEPSAAGTARRPRGRGAQTGGPGRGRAARGGPGAEAAPRPCGRLRAGGPGESPGSGSPRGHPARCNPAQRNGHQAASKRGETVYQGGAGAVSTVYLQISQVSTPHRLQTGFSGRPRCSGQPGRAVAASPRMNNKYHFPSCAQRTAGWLRAPGVPAGSGVPGPPLGLAGRPCAPPRGARALSGQ